MFGKNLKDARLVEVECSRKVEAGVSALCMIVGSVVMGIKYAVKGSLNTDGDFWALVATLGFAAIFVFYWFVSKKPVKRVINLDSPATRLFRKNKAGYAAYKLAFCVIDFFIFVFIYTLVSSSDGFSIEGMLAISDMMLMVFFLVMAVELPPSMALYSYYKRGEKYVDKAGKAE